MQIDQTRMRRQAGRAARLLKALSHESRLAILCRLVDGEHSVGELQAAAGLGQSALSQHLARLRADGFVRTRRDGTTILYSLVDDKPSRIIETLHSLYCGPGR